MPDHDEGHRETAAEEEDEIGGQLVAVVDGKGQILQDKKNKTCIINDPLGQTHVPIIVFKRSLFCDILRSGSDRRTYVRK